MTVELIEMLSILRKPAKDSAEYFQRLVKSTDRYLHVGGLASLLTLDALPRSQWNDALAASNYGSIASRAFTFFEIRHEYDLAEQVVATYESAKHGNIADLMRASLRVDDAAVAEQHGSLFLDDAQITHLFTASRHAETAFGWRAATIWAARAALLYAALPTAALPLLALVENANQLELMREILDIFTAGDVFPPVRRLFRASLAVAQQKPSDALALLSALKLEEIPDDMRAKVCSVLAKAHESSGDFKNAARWYAKMNDPAHAKAVDKTGFMRRVNRLSETKWGPLSSDKNESFLMMVGFPRSGTTLLENALAAHPDIETFEEIPSLESTCDALEDVLDKGIMDGPERQSAIEAARSRYYFEIMRRIKNNSAKVYIDKMPIRSAHIKLMEQLFPTKRYIFSLRHPLDVVLSCFKQPFTANQAMANFRNITDACVLYDRAMSLWFEVFPGESDRVHYVRYEELVTNFDRVLNDVLAFCGVPWSDSVRHFQETAERRRVATPSYSKVRSGLTLGVQSSRQNFRFLFEPRDAKLLDRWVKRFGYDANPEVSQPQNVNPESRAESGGRQQR